MLKNGISKRNIIIIIVLLIILVIISIVGIIFIINSNKTTSEDENNISTDTNIEVDTLKFDEINCELSNDTITEYPNVKKDYFKSDDGEVEINISTFDTNIPKADIYNEKTVKDGVILFYYGTDRNYIEKFNMDGESSWKCGTAPIFEFYDFMEVVDGYFMLGKAEDKYVIIKIDIEGKMINSVYVQEDITDIAFIESETDNQKGYLEIIGLNAERNLVIITYDNNVNQQNVLNTNTKEIDCEKIIEKNSYYYGIGINSDEGSIHSANATLLFKIDNLGNEIFKYDIEKNSDWTKYLESNSWLEDISVNNDYIFVIATNKNDVYVLDLEGNLIKPIGYNTDNDLNGGYNSAVENVVATDEGVFVYGKTTAPNNIDMISNDLDIQYRINISNTQLFPASTTVNALNSRRLLEDMYIDAELYDNSSIIIYQYKFNQN